MTVIDGPAAKDSGIFGLECTVDTSRIVLLAVPFDATTSYGGGTDGGPRAILQASHQVDLFDIETGRPYEAGICMLEAPDTIALWNAEAKAAASKARQAQSDPERQALCARVNALGARVNDWLRALTEQHLQAGRIVGVVGGDHSTPLGAIEAYAARYPNMGILHIDAHADLRQAYEGFQWSHASIMANVLQRTAVQRLVQVGIRDFCEPEYEAIQQSKGRIRTFFDAEVKAAQYAGEAYGDIVKRIVAALPQQVYISFDIDGLDPALCPSTGTPVPGGLNFTEATALIAGVQRAGKQIVGFDLNEVAPAANGSEWDGNVGARMLYKLCGHTLLAQP